MPGSARRTSPWSWQYWPGWQSSSAAGWSADEGLRLATFAGSLGDLLRDQPLGVPPGQLFARELLGLGLPITPDPAIADGYRAALAGHFPESVRSSLDQLEPAGRLRHRGRRTRGRDLRYRRPRDRRLCGPGGITPGAEVEREARHGAVREFQMTEDDDGVAPAGRPRTAWEKPVPTENRVPSISSTSRREPALLLASPLEMLQHA